MAARAMTVFGRLCVEQQHVGNRLVSRNASQIAGIGNGNCLYNRETEALTNGNDAVRGLPPMQLKEIGADGPHRQFDIRVGRIYDHCHNPAATTQAGGERSRLLRHYVPRRPGKKHQAGVIRATGDDCSVGRPRTIDPADLHLNHGQ